jgi:hypothetical protein
MKKIAILSAILVQALFVQGIRAQGGVKQTAMEVRDGAHDFDFKFGTWKTHIRLLQKPLEGSNDWSELNGIVFVRKVWNGRAYLEEIEADGATGHFEGLTLFLYNPKSHQWSMNFSASGDGTVGEPGIGQFENGRGEFYHQETYKGRTVFVRFIWSDITPDKHHVEQAFSADGGKTWEPNFVADLDRVVTPAISTGYSPTEGAPHDFDFAYGKWKEQSSRLQDPLTGSTSWTQLNGVSVTSPIWNGRANMTELESNGPNGRLELLALRLYNPAARQWNLYFATSGVGVLGMPASVGSFGDQKGEFYDQETYKDRTIWVRFRIFPISKDSMQSEQAFSPDAGKTWETNWVNKYTRVNP